MSPFPFRHTALGIAFLLIVMFAFGARSLAANADALLIIAVIFVVAVVVVVAALWMRVARRRDERDRIRRARIVIEEHLHAVASDILRLEERVRAAGNEEALAHFRIASTTYTEVSMELDASDTAAELTDLAARLDGAIWQLDATEALLEGTPLPPKPLPETARKAAMPLPAYRRRPGRSSCMGVAGLTVALLDGDAGATTGDAGLTPPHSMGGMGLLGTVLWGGDVKGAGGALDELRRRFAAGEVTDEEFAAGRRRLEGRLPSKQPGADVTDITEEV